MYLNERDIRPERLYKFSYRPGVNMENNGKLQPVLEMLNQRYEKYHNILVTNERIKKSLGITRGKAHKKVTEMLYHEGILEPYYEGEAIEVAKVWKVNIKKVKSALGQ